jgi:beta-glucosidase
MTNRREFLAGTGAWAALYSTRLSAQKAKSPAKPLLFPENFLWGAATAAMQVENSPATEGGGQSFWEPFVAAHPKLVKDGSSPLVTCNETRYWREDLEFMRQIGLNSYRFSISWPRVLPDGKGRVNQAGLDFYDRFIDALLAARIRPLLTVFHFDYPEALQQSGGWLAPDSPQWFADYARLLAARYSDRVEDWLTINEPNIFWGFGAEAGAMPPGKQMPEADLASGLHHLLLGHGRAVGAIRAASKRPVKIGLPIAGMMQMPATNSPADWQAARLSVFTPRKAAIIPGLPPMGMLNNGLWLDPIFKGSYSEGAFALYPSLRRLARPEDMKIISSPVDRCAVNLYFASTVKAGPDGQPEAVPLPPNTEHTHYGWPVTPDVLYWGPKLLHERYGAPVLITENGMSWADQPSADGRVHDPQRIAFLNRYLNALRLALHDGVPVEGYMHWSLLDNWEFTSGFTEQFGLVYVDHKTQKRILKNSALYYRNIIQSRGAALM